MCGIVGLLDGRNLTSERLEHTIRRMTATLAHRGPDDDGTWVAAEAGVALGHRRLAIIDLTQEGRQPMISADGRFVVTYNGEIYNFVDLRERLSRTGVQFRGRSDTEVLVEAIVAWGLLETVALLDGMFAFAVWDRVERRLSLVRDRMGEKPLYYGRVGPSLVFASELKAIRAHTDFQARIDRGALSEFLRRDCVPAPLSIYEGIRKLPPGHVLHVDDWTSALPAPSPYWSLADVARKGMANQLQGPTADIVDEVEMAIAGSVGRRMVADVPVGAFLSGGIDSSLVAALMRPHGATAPRTFTIGFDDAPYDESPQARRVADHLGTDHTELRVTEEDIVRAVTRVPAVYDEPFADSSQIPTFLVAEMTRRHVTVSLSGDGGDELFAGYSRYQLFDQPMWRVTRHLPHAVRARVGTSLGRVPGSVWDGAARIGAPVLPRALRQTRPGDKIAKLATIFKHDSARSAYSALMSQWEDPGAVLAENGQGARRRQPLPWVDAGSVVDQLMYCDQAGYLPDDILAKVDRATMAVSLEARVPLLDHNLVELAWRVPLACKIRDGSGKWILRQILARHLPVELFDRPKMGFGVPLGAWLRGPLQEWADGQLDPRRLAEHGLFDVDAVARRWKDHLSGDGPTSGAGRLWTVLMFQAWLEASKAA
jgi:asparagine synthase (glutamine-hydrolysing)